MEYKLDVTNSYQEFICLDNNLGIENYLSFDLESGEDDFQVNLENIAVNMSEEIWYLPIIKQNPKSVLNNALNEIDLNDPSSILIILIRKARLIIKNFKNMYLKIHDEKNERFHSTDSNFTIGDKYIWLAGKSADYSDQKINLKIVFSGRLNFVFEESDILIQTIEFRDYITHHEVDIINRYQELIVKLKNR
ncbi:hypothetical protein GQ593_13370, partial [Gilliamella sp. Pas-s25]